MIIIDKDKWNRNEHFDYFNSLDYPYLNICGNLEMTDLYSYIKKNELPVFLTILYIASKVANEIDAFKFRIRKTDIVFHEKIRPSFTLLNDDKSFSYCTVNYIDDFNKFIEKTKECMDIIRKNPTIEDEVGVDDMLFITSIPWIKFTSIDHPINLKPSDSFPRISWGKISWENGKVEIPISIFAHHGLVDGYDIGRYFQRMEEIFKKPELYLV